MVAEEELQAKLSERLFPSHGPALKGCSIQIAIAALGNSRNRIGSVRVAKAIYGSKAALRRKLENCAIVIGAATRRCAVKITIRLLVSAGPGGCRPRRQSR